MYCGISKGTENARSTTMRPNWSLIFHPSEVHVLKSRGARFILGKDSFPEDLGPILIQVRI